MCLSFFFCFIFIRLISLCILLDKIFLSLTFISISIKIFIRFIEGYVGIITFANIPIIVKFIFILELFVSTY